MNRRESMSHEQARELLPWLVNGSLDELERDLVDEHARTCVVCRRDLAELQNLQESIAQMSDTAETPAPDMRRINARIDALIERQGRGREYVSSLREFFASPWRIAFAVQTVLVLALGIALLWPQNEEAGFTTLTAPSELPDGQYIRVVVDPSLGAVELSRLIGDLGLTVIDGPSERGVTTLRITTAVSAADRDTIVSGLLSNQGILFAQPISIESNR